MSPRLPGGLIAAAMSMIGWIPPAVAGPREDSDAALARGDVDGALSVWRRVLDRAPGDADARLELGRMAIRARQLDLAIQTLQALSATDARAHYFLGLALRKAGRNAEAAESYRRAISAAPEDPDPRFGQAETLKQLGDGPGALESYRAYVRLEARPAEAAWVARANEEIARLEASETVTPADAPGEVSGPPPGDPSAPASGSPAATGSGIGASRSPDQPGDPAALISAGRAVEAQRLLLADLGRSPDALGLRHRAAVASLLAGDLPEAERQAVAVARLDPDNPTAALMALSARSQRPEPATPTLAEAELALREGRNRTALDLAGRRLQARPGPAEAAALARIRGLAFHRLGRGGEAFEALRGASLAFEPAGAYWLALGDALQVAGDRPAARRAWRIAADLTSQDAPIGRAARERIQPAPLREGELR